jgi:hypothetical protein
MLRIVLGVLIASFPAVVAVRGEMPDTIDGAFELGFWITAAGIGLILIVSGVAGVVRDVRTDRAERRALRSRFALSRVSVGGVRVALIAALFSLALLSQHELEVERADWPPREEILHLPRADVLRLMSLGFREFAADLVWLRAIGYFGEHLLYDRKYDWLEKYLDTVIALDPEFRIVYRYAGAVMMYNLRIITRDAVERSNHYLELGYRRFPKDWEFPFTICSNYLFELPRFAKDAAEKRRFQETGAEYCREASVLPGALPYLSSMAGSFLSKLGKRQLARQHFRELILRTEDPRIRAKLQQKYAALVSEDSARRVEEEAARFFQRHQASWPFVSSDLFLFLGERGEVLDGAAALRAALGAH